MSSASLTLVIDDVNVLFNISRNDVISTGPSDQLKDSVQLAETDAWNRSLTVITASSVAFWQNVTGASFVTIHDPTV